MNSYVLIVVQILKVLFEVLFDDLNVKGLLIFTKFSVKFDNLKSQNLLKSKKCTSIVIEIL